MVFQFLPLFVTVAVAGAFLALLGVACTLARKERLAFFLHGLGVGISGAMLLAALAIVHR